jgi:hypothetical protein
MSCMLWVENFTDHYIFKCKPPQNLAWLESIEIKAAAMSWARNLAQKCEFYGHTILKTHTSPFINIPPKKSRGTTRERERASPSYNYWPVCINAVA